MSIIEKLASVYFICIPSSCIKCKFYSYLLPSAFITVTSAIAAKHVMRSLLLLFATWSFQSTFDNRRISLTIHSLAFCFSAPLNVKVSSILVAIADQLQKSDRVLSTGGGWWGETIPKHFLLFNLYFRLFR